MGRKGPGYISPTVQREAIARWAEYLNSNERGGELLRGCLHGLGNRNGKMSVTLQDLPCAEHRQSNDAVSPGRIADDKALWRFLAVGRLRRANVQVEHVVIGPIVMFTRSMTWGPSGW